MVITIALWLARQGGVLSCVRSMQPKVILSLRRYLLRNPEIRQFCPAIQGKENVSRLDILLGERQRKSGGKKRKYGSYLELHRTVSYITVEFIHYSRVHHRSTMLVGPVFGVLVSILTRCNFLLLCK